jgi:hypothetical protein
MDVRLSTPLSQFWTFSIVLSFIERKRKREEKVGEGGSERKYRVGGGCNRNRIWQFGRILGSAR